jgi:heme o synthase
LLTKTAKKEASGLGEKIRDLKMLVKFRLNLLVVFTAGIGYVIGSGILFSWSALLTLSLGGFLITGAANALNQVLEKDYDKLMKRTADRPLAKGRMSVSTAVLYAGFMSLIGIFLLASFNPLTALIGTISLIIYAFVYTPVKRISSIAVLVGAIPGALPPMIGWVAATGELGAEAVMLFTLQFVWQFPHFWAIAWLGYDDYAKAGYYLLPSGGERDKKAALQCLIYAGILIPISALLGWYQMVNLGVTLVLLSAAVFYTYYAWRLYKSCTIKAAKELMFSSFFYLPIVMLALLFGAMS